MVGKGGPIGWAGSGEVGCSGGRGAWQHIQMSAGLRGELQTSTTRRAAASESDWDSLLLPAYFTSVLWVRELWVGIYSIREECVWGTGLTGGGELRRERERGEEFRQLVCVCQFKTEALQY